jgi:hypothetical protein
MGLCVYILLDLKNLSLQTFAADFYGFICGKKGIEPTTLVTRTGYQNRSHIFMYNPSMYSKAEAKSQ